MKNLVEYIKEACEDSVAASKKISFNFSGFEGAEDTIKSVKEIAEKDGVEVEVEDEKVSVSLKKDELDKAEGLFELLQDYIQLRGKDQKRASDENYAQKCQSLEKKLNDWRDYVDDVNTCDDEPEKKEDDKKDGSEDKKEEE